MVRTLILYESKYGFTEKIAKNLALILGPARCCRTLQFNEDSKNYESVIICTPIYSESVDNDVLEYVLKNAEWIREKKVVLICTCIQENMEDKYLKPLRDILGDSVISQYSIGGELTLGKLSKNDYALIKEFCNNTGLPFKDYKVFDTHKFDEVSMNIKRIKDKGKNVMETHKLKGYIDDFIEKHNTCALATGHDNNVRVTPIEYLYMNDCLYIISEGGEKFINLINNPNVSICIYDSYKNMNELAGMQIMGTSEMIKIGSDEYISVLTKKGLKYENIMALPISLNLIKVNIKLVEFLWSGFVKLGYDAKQILGNCDLEKI